MSKIDQADALYVDLMRQFPRWPSTFSDCDCGRGMGRGCQPCALCLVDALRELVGGDLAAQAYEAAYKSQRAWFEIKEKLEAEK